MLRLLTPKDKYEILNFEAIVITIVKPKPVYQNTAKGILTIN